MSKSLLIIFVKNPAPGKVKTRLAATLGHETAMSLYRQLLERTRVATWDLPYDKVVYYGQFIDSSDLWEKEHYQKELQKGDDLGERMHYAFEASFKQGYEKVCLIGSDIYGLTRGILEKAFSWLDTKDTVIGPAEDGGYYLIGMTRANKRLFEVNAWSEPTVYEDTLGNILNNDLSYAALPVLNDIDTEEDLEGTDLQWQYPSNS